jgi:hypothetical protein
MAIGTKSDFKIYSPQFWGGVVETLQQNTDLFNAASLNALKLVTRGIAGEYEKESFIKNTANLISRRDPTSVAGVTDAKLAQDEFVGIKVNKRIGPVAETLDAFKKIAVDPGEFSVLLGQQTGVAIAVDYVTNGIGSVLAGIKGAGASLQYDATADTLKTPNHTALVKGMAKFGDRASRLRCFVMHSDSYFKLVQQALADKIFNVADVAVYQGNTATFGKPVVVIDSTALLTIPGGTAANIYEVLCLVEGAVEVAESEQRNITSQEITGLENLVMRIQGEYAYNVRVRGCQWDLTAVAANPTDTQLATSTNWDMVVADVKEMPGVRITFN